MIIKVTAEDIAISRALRNVKSQYKCWLDCPIALAAKREAGTDVSIGMCTITFHGREADVKSLPREAMDFVLAFDCGDRAEPFEFEV